MVPNPSFNKLLRPGYRSVPVVFALVVLVIQICICAAQADQGDEEEQVESVFSKTSNGYVRLLRADGSFQPETYKFGKGEFWGGEIADASIDRLTVDDVARTISPALARQSYLAAKVPSSADLFIVINWGTTAAPEHRTMDLAFENAEKAQNMATSKGSVAKFAHAGDSPVMDGIIGGLGEGSLDGSANTWNLGGNNNRIIQGSSQLGAENNIWETISRKNAGMLGYTSLSDAELQRYRYFVVLLAYDNKTISQRKPKLLWEARLSISQHNNLFDKRLGALAENASAYFGQNSNGLRHKAVPVGFVHIGPIRSLEFPSGSDAAALTSDGAHMAYFRREGSDRSLAVVDVDKPDGVFSARIPGREVPARIVWCDSSHIQVSFTSTNVITFDTVGRSWSTVGSQQGSAITGKVVNQDEMQAKLEGKFPHRTTSILGSDSTGRRYLIAVADNKGATRYFVFDDKDDVLVDVGRAARIP